MISLFITSVFVVGVELFGSAMIGVCVTVAWLVAGVVSPTDATARGDAARMGNGSCSG